MSTTSTQSGSETMSNRPINDDLSNTANMLTCLTLEDAGVHSTTPPGSPPASAYAAHQEHKNGNRDESRLDKTTSIQDQTAGLPKKTNNVPAQNDETPGTIANTDSLTSITTTVPAADDSSHQDSETNMKSQLTMTKADCKQLHSMVLFIKSEIPASVVELDRRLRTCTAIAKRNRREGRLSQEAEVDLNRIGRTLRHRFEQAKRVQKFAAVDEDIANARRHLSASESKPKRKVEDVDVKHVILAQVEGEVPSPRRVILPMRKTVQRQRESMKEVLATAGADAVSSDHDIATVGEQSVPAAGESVVRNEKPTAEDKKQGPLTEEEKRALEAHEELLWSWHERAQREDLHGVMPLRPSGDLEPMDEQVGVLKWQAKCAAHKARLCAEGVAAGMYSFKAAAMCRTAPVRRPKASRMRW